MSTDPAAFRPGDPPEDLVAWMTERLVPAWIGRTVEPGRPGYVEVLDESGRPVRDGRHTTLVTARLIYVFSHAARLGARRDAIEAAGHGLRFLLDGCRDGDGPFRHAVGADGAPIDGRSDLYDLAFVLFGLAWFHRATGEPAVRRIAEETFGFIERRLASDAGGFREDTLGTLPRRQNPHMHLLEACHAWAEATGEERWLERANGLVALFRERLFDRRTGTLGEYFEGDWRPSAGAAGRLREPGHHLEWAWLLDRHAEMTGDASVRVEADALHAFATRRGMARMPDGLPVVVDGVEPDGRVVTPTRLLWPQTEAIKAAAVRALGGDTASAERLSSLLSLVFRHYVDRESGLWRNQLDGRGEPVTGPLPIRVLYHIVLGLAEAARSREAIRPPAEPTSPARPPSGA